MAGFTTGDSTAGTLTMGDCTVVSIDCFGLASEIALIVGDAGVGVAVGEIRAGGKELFRQMDAKRPAFFSG